MTAAAEQCYCGSCERVRLQAGKPCFCCAGRGIVLSALGETRPCSRCEADKFSAWSRFAPLHEPPQ